MKREISYADKGKKVVYTGDSRPCKGILELAREADLLIHESTYLTENEETSRHSCFDDAVRVAKEAGVKKLALTHISRRYNNNSTELKEVKKKLDKNTILAEDLMTIVV